MIGDLVKAALAEKLVERDCPRRALFDLTGKPVGPDSDLTKDANLRMTDMTYWIRYLPEPRWENMNYILYSDLFPEGRVRFQHLTGLKLLKEHKAAVKWLLKYTNLSEEILTIARQNANINIPLAFDVVKYDKMIRSQLPKERRTRNLSVLVGVQFWEEKGYTGKIQEKKK